MWWSKISGGRSGIAWRRGIGLRLVGEGTDCVKNVVRVTVSGYQDSLCSNYCFHHNLVTHGGEGGDNLIAEAGVPHKTARLVGSENGARPLHQIGVSGDGIDRERIGGGWW